MALHHVGNVAVVVAVRGRHKAQAVVWDGSDEFAHPPTAVVGQHMNPLTVLDGHRDEVAIGKVVQCRADLLFQIRRVGDGSGVGVANGAIDIAFDIGIDTLAERVKKGDKVDNVDGWICRKIAVTT